MAFASVEETQISLRTPRFLQQHLSSGVTDVGSIDRLL